MHTDTPPPLASQPSVRTTSNTTALEEYALLSNRATVALVTRHGSVDWLCPRVDGEAIFAALLGTDDHGHWTLGIRNGQPDHRFYREWDTFCLVTQWSCSTGRAEVEDVLCYTDNGDIELVRTVRCTEGRIWVQHDLRIRHAYGALSPAWSYASGVEMLFYPRAAQSRYRLIGPMLAPRQWPCVATDFTGLFPLTVDDEPLTWRLRCTAPALDSPPPMPPVSPVPSTPPPLASSIRSMSGWLPIIHTSNAVLHGLALRNGAILAAATTSLPEEFGGQRNWDYRYCWLRDSALTVAAVLEATRFGCDTTAAHQLAHAWRSWLVTTLTRDMTTGDPNHNGEHPHFVDAIHIMYDIAGNAELDEHILAHLPGYEHSLPVRIGNGAAEQYQADVFGEVVIALSRLRAAGIADSPESWALNQRLVRLCHDNFGRSDHGIWEMRGELRFFTYSRVMMWAAFDRTLRDIDTYNLDAHPDDVAVWRADRDRLKEEIMSNGFDPHHNTFTQSYDSTAVDASLLLLPTTGFIAADDPAMLGTVAAIEHNLLDSYGFVYRYRTDDNIDGITGSEYSFLICSFWLVEQYARSGETAKATALMNKLTACATDLGLLAEEYNPQQQRLAGNFPQAFSHIGVITAAGALADAHINVAQPPRP